MLCAPSPLHLRVDAWCFRAATVGSAVICACVRGCVGAWVRGCVGAWVRVRACVCARARWCRPHGLRPAAETWTEQNYSDSVWSERAYLSCTQFNGELFVMGGCDTSNCPNDVWQYSQGAFAVLTVALLGSDLGPPTRTTHVHIRSFSHTWTRTRPVLARVMGAPAVVFYVFMRAGVRAAVLCPM